MFHISSPKDGWSSPNPRKHHDFIDIMDLPQEWPALDITVEIEAKAKEVAIKKLINDVRRVKKQAPVLNTHVLKSCF